MTIAGIVVSGFRSRHRSLSTRSQFGVVHVSFPAVVTVAITLAAAVVICIFFAASPRHDPLGLSESATDNLCLCRRSHAGAAVHAHPADDALAVQRVLSSVTGRWWFWRLLTPAWRVSELLQRRES